MSRRVAERQEWEAETLPMKRIEHPILTRDLRELHIYPLSDMHVGHRGFRRAAFRERVRQILDDPFGLAVGVGDWIENVTRSSVGDIFEELEIPNPQDQCDEVVSEMRSLEERLVALIRGNHCWRTPKDMGLDPMKYIAQGLRVPYFRDEAALIFSFGSGYNSKPLVYSVYLNHLSGGGSTDGGKVNALSKAGRFIVADVCIGGHTHMPETHVGAVMVPDLRNGNMIQRRIQYVNAGTFQGGRGGFPSRKVMPPAVVGSPLIRLCGERRKVTAEV